MTKFVRLITAALAVAVLSAAAISGLYAASRAVLSGRAPVTFTAMPSGGRPDDGTLSDQRDTLNNAGFNVSVEDGVVLMANNFESLSKDPQIYHDNLIEAGILSYRLYEGMRCERAETLTVVLDLSDYYFQTLGGSCFDGLAYAMLGNAHGMNGAVTFDIDVGIFAADGTPARTAEGQVSGGGGSVVDGRKYSTYALEIILPDIGEDVMTFDVNSLNFHNSGAPDTLTLDIAAMSLVYGPDAPKRLVIEQGAAGVNGQPLHIHFVGRTEDQLQYALARALEGAGNFDMTYLNRGTAFSCEVFAADSGRQSTLRAGVTKTKTGSYGNGAAEIRLDVFGGQGAAETADRIAVLDLCHWLAYANTQVDVSGYDLVLRHVKRTDNGFDRDGAGTVTYGNADADGLHEVTCTHSGVIGYFAAGRRLYDADRNPIV